MADAASAMYVVAAGTVQLHKKRRILAELGFGTCVGQAAILQHSLHAGTHISSATALEDCILLSISREHLDALIKEAPQVSRGVLNAVASSLQLLYFEVGSDDSWIAMLLLTVVLLLLKPLRTIAQSGSLPRRDRRASLTAKTAQLYSSDADSMVKMTEFLTTNIKAALSVDRAAKSFLYNVGRSQSAHRVMPLSLPGIRGRRHSFSNLQPMGRSSSSGTLASKGLHALSDPADYTTFEKSIHLKASHLMRNLDDDKVSRVAQISRVVVLDHGDVLYSSGTKMECVYVIINGTMEIMSFQSERNAVSAPSIKLHDGDSFGEAVTCVLADTCKKIHVTDSTLFNGVCLGICTQRNCTGHIYSGWSMYAF